MLFAHRPTRAAALTGLAAGVAAAVTAAAPALPAGAVTPTTVAPLVGAGSAGSLAGRYLVVLKAGAATGTAVQDATRRGARVTQQYRAALHGYAAALTAAQLSAVRADPDVAYVAQDRVLHADTTQSGATWGLDRIDQRTLPLNGTYVYTPTGAGVTAYVIDTGIRTTHTQFGGRAVQGATAINDGRGAQDCNGHGTHVAGTIGGSTYGVAKAVRLVAVRVLDCTGSGSTSGVVAGVDWVTANHAANAVANMSLGGGVDSTLDSAVSRSIASGVTYAIAAGNSNANACNSSPARVSAALTVGATTSTDARASYSNVGSCVDLFAPGSSITSAWDTSDTATNTISGTSMATPHVAGVAALYLSSHPGASPATVAAAVKAGATSGVLTGVGSGSPNLLLYSRF